MKDEEIAAEKRSVADMSQAMAALHEDKRRMSREAEEAVRQCAAALAKSPGLEEALQDRATRAPRWRTKRSAHERGPLEIHRHSSRLILGSNRRLLATGSRWRKHWCVSSLPPLVASTISLRRSR